VAWLNDEQRSAFNGKVFYEWHGCRPPVVVARCEGRRHLLEVFPTPRHVSCAAPVLNVAPPINQQPTSMRPPSKNCAPQARHAAAGALVTYPGCHEGVVTNQDETHSTLVAAHVHPARLQSVQIGYVDVSHLSERFAVVFLSRKDAVQDEFSANCGVELIRTGLHGCTRAFLATLVKPKTKVDVLYRTAV